MSHKQSTLRRTAVGVGAAAVGAFLSLGTAAVAGAESGSIDDPVANIYPNPSGYVNLYGAFGEQGEANNAADLALFAQNPGGAAAFDILVNEFQENETHPLSDLVFALIPTAFYFQTDPDIDGTFFGDAFLVPDSALGYLAQTLDFMLLTPTGLGFVLDPLIEILTGQPPF